MYIKLKKLLMALIVFIMAFTTINMSAVAAGTVNDRSDFETDEYGDTYFDNDETGYSAYIVDDADILSPGSSDYNDLLDILEDMTEYGNIVVYTTDYNSGSASSKARDLANYEYGGTDSITVLLIDMDNRELFIFSNGKINRVINASRAENITYNVYKYATDGDYERCAYEAFSQELVLLQGGKISEPMKYVCNALLALLFSVFIIYYVAKKSSSSEDIVPVNKLLQNTIYYNKMNNVDIIFQHRSRTRRSSSSSSSGGSGGGHSSGGSGGGHRF